jgi:hypothetical protein
MTTSSCEQVFAPLEHQLHEKLQEHSIPPTKKNNDQRVATLNEVNDPSIARQLFHEDISPWKGS